MTHSLTAQKSQLSPKSSVEAWLEPVGEKKITPIDHLWNRFDGMYPNRWRAAFANDQAIANWRNAWVAAFAEEGVSVDDVARGLSECRKRFDWPPSLPEFLKACKFNIDPEAAFHEAVAQLIARESGADQWSHPAIYWAAVAVGTFDVRSSQYSRIENRWKKALSEKLSQPCEPVPEPMLALPPPGETTPDPERVAALLAKAKSVISKKQFDGNGVAHV